MRAVAGKSEQGFSLIEVLIVVALIAFVYTVAIPQFSLRTGAEVTSKVNQVASDVRSAFDLAVLSNKTYRLVFVMNSGDYWLEEADRENVLLGTQHVDHDPTEAEEKDAKAQYDAKMQEYQDMAGRAVVDPKDDKEIPPASPVVEAKDRLKPAAWTPVENMEWSKRSLGPNLMIKKMQAEHHGRPQEVGELGVEGRAMIYFFPSGYVERAYLLVQQKKDDLVPDDSTEPYTIVTDPREGTADVLAGEVAVDVHDDRAAE